MERLFPLIVFAFIALVNFLSWMAKQKKIQEKKREALKESETEYKQAGTSQPKGQVRQDRPVSQPPQQQSPRPQRSEPSTVRQEKREVEQQPATVRRISPRSATRERATLDTVLQKLHRPSSDAQRIAAETEKYRRRIPAPEPSALTPKKKGPAKVVRPEFKVSFWSNAVIVSEVLQPPLSRRKRIR